MSRSISQIYSEAVSKRNDYLQLTELNSGRTEQKMSVMNMITYVMACLIFTYETILDVFEINIAELISGRINGTPEWYAKMALKFQFNSLNNLGDTIIFNDDTMKIEYQTPNEQHRIIAKSAWQNYDAENGIILKVCKDNTDSSEIENGTLYKPLTNAEMTAFMSFIDQIKFVGAKIFPMSVPGDIITIECSIDYDSNYIQADQAFENVKAKIIEYAKNLEYNGFIYYQSFIDAILSAEHILNVHAGAKIWVKSYDPAQRQYIEPIQIQNRYRTASGYVKFLDEGSENTINMTNLTFNGVTEA